MDTKKGTAPRFTRFYLLSVSSEPSATFLSAFTICKYPNINNAAIGSFHQFCVAIARKSEARAPTGNNIFAIFIIRTIGLFIFHRFKYPSKVYYDAYLSEEGLLSYLYYDSHFDLFVPRTNKGRLRHPLMR